MTPFVVLLAVLACDTPFDASIATGTGTSPMSTIAAITIAGSSPTLAVGQSTQLTATVIDAAGKIVSNATISWVSQNPDVASVTNTGVATAIEEGAATIAAKADGAEGTLKLDVLPPSEPPAGGIRVSLAVQRVVDGSGTVLVSNAIPLKPGMLMPGNSRHVHVYVKGTEQTVYTEELEGRHPDGSLRSIFIQFYYPLTANEVVDGELVIGETRASADLTKPSIGRSRPSAVALPVDPQYLVATNIVGPTLTSEETQQWGGVYAKYDADFAQYEEYQWQQEGEQCNDYYDRALAYYAQWARTGNVRYWQRGTVCAWNYRVGYLEPNNYGTSPHWSQVEGMELHYLLTGDDSSRTAVRGIAKVLAYWLPKMDSTQVEGGFDDRIRARTIMATLTAWRINAGDRAVYQQRLDDLLPKVLSTQAADGHDPFLLTCQMSLNYMAGQLNDALIKYYMYYKPDARIPGHIQRSVDYLWNTQWVAGAKAFRYVSGVCPGVGDTTPAADLNNLMVNGFTFTYTKTRDVKYRDEADQVFAGAVLNTFLSGSKQFNQQYTSSFLYFPMRQQ